MPLTDLIPQPQSKQVIMSLRKKVLAAFDVDNTMNTLFLESALFTKINSKNRDKYIDGRKPWEERVMNAMSMHPYTLEEVTNHIKTIGIVPGIAPMLNNLKDKGVDLIVLSGGSDLLVKIWLEQQQLGHIFQDIIANRMQESSGMLMYRPMTKVAPCIPSCRSHLCKRHLIDLYTKGKNYEQVFMVGDGENDYCAMQSIKSGGSMVRNSSQLSWILEKNPELRKAIPNTVYEWSDGNDLDEQFSIALEK